MCVMAYMVCHPCPELCDAFYFPRAGWRGGSQLLNRSTHHHRRLLSRGEETADAVHLLPRHPHWEVSPLPLPLPTVAASPQPASLLCLTCAL